MYNKQIKKNQSVVWKHYSHEGWSIFASLKRRICIGVLTVATIGTVAPVQASNSAKHVINPETAEGDVETTSLESVTVSGTMAPLTQLQSARIVAVLSRNDIEQAGVQSVNDLFKLTSGVDVRQRSGFGIQTDISIDGGTYEQITIMLNGVNISNPHTGHLASDFPVSIADIERIEVLEGAASRVYGGTAFGGAINIVTRKEASNTIAVGAEGGSFGTMQADGRVAWIKGKVANRISGGGGRSDGGTMNDAWSKGQLFYQGDLSNQSVDMNWQFGFSRKEYGANTFYSGMSNDQWEQNERYLISVAAETKGKVHFTPSVYWNRTYDNYQWHKGTPNNSHQADVFGAKMGAWLQWILGKTAVSAELRQEGILSSSLGKLMDEADYIWAHGAEKQYTKQAQRTNINYNLEHNIILNRWTISAGVVANMNTMATNKFRFYPGVDICYRPVDRIKLFASYNKGFRMPSYTDLYYSSPDITGNDKLKPEENRSLSLGTRYAHNGVELGVRAFYNRGRNMIDYVKAMFGDAAHADNFDLDNIGVQADAKLDFNRLCKKDIWLKSLSVGYTYMHQDRDGKYDIFTSLYADDYLRHKFVASLNHKIVSKLSATWSVRAQKRMGSYQVFDGLTPTNQLRNYHPYATLDIKLQWTDKNYSVYVTGTNVTNHKYMDLGNIPQPGLWLMAGARWNMTF